MKKTIKTETKVIETAVWTAIDGKEFLDENECCNYEKEYSKTLEASWNKIPKSSAACNDFLWGGCDYEEFWLIKPRTFDEVAIINMYCGLIGTDLLTQEDVGHIVTLNNCDGNWYRMINGMEDALINPIYKAIETMKTKLDNWGKEKTETEVEDN